MSEWDGTAIGIDAKDCNPTPGVVPPPIPENLRAKVVRGKGIGLKWKKVKGCTYVIRRRATGTVRFTSEKPGYFDEDERLKHGRTYEYSVRSVQVVEGQRYRSNWSDPVEVTYRDKRNDG